MPNIQPVPSHLPTGDWSEAALRVLRERYLWKDENGEIVETPDEAMWRVARAIAEAEPINVFEHIEDRKQIVVRKRDYYAEAFYRQLVSRKFMPNTPTIANAGKSNGMAQSACYVIPIEDSLTGIADALKQQMLIHQSGGGTGMSFSRLRPAGSRVKTTDGVASGPVSFMGLFDKATDVIKQGGQRRGANMSVLRCDHPDILEFIDCKRQDAKGNWPMSNFNISVGITDAFMAALRGYGMRASRPSNGEEYQYELTWNGISYGWLDARDVWQKLITAAWTTGDPGLFFVDRVNQGRANYAPDVFTISSCNPCGEQSLEDFGVCNLISINLERFVFIKGGNAWVDYVNLEETVRLAVRFADNVITTNEYPLPEITYWAEQGRRIGLGVMGWADALMKARIPYDSERARELGQNIMAFISREALKESERLAEEKAAFPLQSQSRYKDEKPRRNGAITSIQPNGTTSIIADCSSGIEPIFALAFRHIVGERRLTFVNQYAQGYLDELASRGAMMPHEVDRLRQYLLENGSFPRSNEFQQWHVDTNGVFKTALEISPTDHVLMQAAFQAETDNGVSKCVVGDTLVLTSNGIVRIAEMDTSNRTADTFTDLGVTVSSEQGERVLARDFYYGGVRETIRVRTRHGSAIEGTPNHRIRVEDNSGDVVWRRLDEMQVGDKVMIHLGQNLFPSGDWITADFARLMGHLVADGSIIDNRVTLSHMNTEVNSDRQMLLNLPEITAAVMRRGKNGGERENPVKITEDYRKPGLMSVQRNGRGLVAYLERDMGMKRRAANKEVPWAVLRSSFAVQREFLRGLFTDCGVANRESANLSFNTASLMLARQVRFMLMNMGMYSTFAIHPVNGKDYYQLRLPVADALMFAEKIGFIELSRQEQFAGWAAVYQPNRKIVARGSERNHWHVGGALPQERDDYRIEPVRSIESGEAEVFDIYVPDGNAFITEGMVSHNTVNLPNEATVEDIDQAYRLAWDTGCMGITAFRAGSKGDMEQVLHLGTEDAQNQPTAPQQGITDEGLMEPSDQQIPMIDFLRIAESAGSGVYILRDLTRRLVEEIDSMMAPQQTEVRHRPSRLTGASYREETPLGTAFITVNHDEQGQPVEVFLNVGKAGSDTQADAEAIGRLLSLIFRMPSPMAPHDRLVEAQKQLQGIGGARTFGFGPGRVRSIPDAIAHALYRFMLERSSGTIVPTVIGLDPGFSLTMNGRAHFAAFSDAVAEADVTNMGASIRGADLCPACGHGTYVHEAGCGHCLSCGYDDC